MNSLERFYLGRTLVDCTKTDDTSLENTKTRNQHRNWETLVQVLGLRAQLISLTVPYVSNMNIDGLKFGLNFSKRQRVWTFRFSVEHEDVFKTDKSSVGILDNDFTNVPIILGLEETAKIISPVFCVDIFHRNIYFEPN